MTITYNDSGTLYNTAVVTYAGGPFVPTPVFPTAPTAVRADLNIAGVWTNITSDLYATEKVVINRGRQDETSSPQPSTCTVALNNRTGKYTPKNPAGAFYPNFNRNTPIRIGVGTPPAGTGAIGATGTALVAPSVVAEASGLAISCWAVESGSATITTPAGYTALTTATSGGLVNSCAGYNTFAAGTVPAATATSSVSAANASATVFIPGGTAVTTAVGVQPYSVNSEYTPVTVAGINALAGDVLVICAVWSQDPNNAMVSTPWDSSQASEWSLTADSGQSAVSAPRTQIWTRYCPIAEPSLNASVPNWILGAADLQVSFVQVRGAAAWNPRFHGFCSEITSTADLSGNDVRCAVVAGSVLRQRGQGVQKANSAAFRFFSNSNSVAYWPLEGGAQTQTLASPFPGVAQATFVNAATIGGDSTSFAVSSAALTSLTSGYVSCPVPSYTMAAPSSGGAYGFVAINAAPTATGQGIIWATLGAGGTLGTVIVTYTSATSATLTVFNTSGVSVASSAISFGLQIGTPAMWFICWNQNAANPTTQVDVGVGRVDSITQVQQFFSLSAVVGQAGPITRVALGQEPSNTAFFDKGVTVGHVAVSSYAINSSNLTISPTSTMPRTIARTVVLGWAFEVPTTRFLRICQEESIPIASAFQQNTTSISNGIIACGAQPIGDVLSLLALTQATDVGELAESRATPGLLYRPGAAMTARPVYATVDFAARMIAGQLQPTEDDQLTRNDVTVTQNNGASVEVFQASGPLSVLLPPNGVGIYTASYTVTVAYQSRDLPQLAAWYLAQGVVNQQRFKSVTMLLEAVPSSVTALAAIDIGNHVQIANTPVWIQPGPSDVTIIGLSETIGAVAEWDITLTAEPYGPNAVLRIDAASVGGVADTMGRVDSGSSALNGTMTTSSTSVAVFIGTSPSDAWANANCPFDILVAGERMTVTAIVSTLPTQTFTVTRSVNGVVKTHVTGEPVHVYWQTNAGLAGGY